jgi:hypothetical protein
MARDAASTGKSPGLTRRPAKLRFSLTFRAPRPTYSPMSITRRQVLALPAGAFALTEASEIYYHIAFAESV